VKNVNEFRALHAKWLNLHEAAFYCGCSVNHFNKTIRPLAPEVGARPVLFDREDLDKVLVSRKIGNLPAVNSGRVPISTAERRAI
jgi:hypothetical protein